MTKIIREVKLTEEDILKNTSKNISHSIKKQKRQELMYTSFLTTLFIILIPLTIYFSFRVDSNQLFESSLYKNTNISINKEYITLDKKNIMSDEEALKKNPIVVKYTNLTNNNINFIIHFAKDEKSIEKCNCNDTILDYHKIKYSIDGKTIHSFQDESMIITANMIKKRSKDEIKIWIWVDSSVDKDKKFLGKIVFEELEDMDL